MNHANSITQADGRITLYSYGDTLDLTKQELFLCVFVEVALEHFDAPDVAGLFAIVIGQPILPTRGKFGGAIKGTSLASVISRKLLNYRTQRVLPTIIGPLWGPLRFRAVNNLGAFVGRWIPWLGVAIMAYDLTAIDFKAILRFNQLVEPEDRISDGTVGTLG